jgi:hypothetical protein
MRRGLLLLLVIFVACEAEEDGQGGRFGNKDTSAPESIWADLASEETAPDIPDVTAEVDTEAPAGCITEALCAETLDCQQGERCNRTLSPPRCQKLYCAKEGEACDPDHGSDLCEGGLDCITGDESLCLLCEPGCEGKLCGTDACGRSCGECSGVQEECINDGCVCMPDCAGKDCGPNVCGGYCGACDWECVDNICVDPVPTLSFYDAVGDDQKSCVDTNTCTYELAFPGQRNLPVRLSLGGEQVANAAITYTITEDPNGIGAMMASTVYTDDSGVATGIVKVIGPFPGALTVQVSVYGDSSAAPIFFVIQSP